MKNLFRPLLALMLALSMGMGVVALTGCAGSSSASSSSAASSASASNSASSDDNSSSSDEQDDCYGDDLPATKSDKSQ